MDKKMDIRSGKIELVEDIMQITKDEEIYDNLHLEFLISFTDDDRRNTQLVSINRNVYSLFKKYDYRSQGNAHLIFQSESGFWFSLSFDGHKGRIYANKNPIIDYLVVVLNGYERYSDRIGEISEDEIYKILNSYTYDLG